jgi:2-haloacid dehalogenase
MTARVLLFDVFGTLVDWRSSLTDLAAAAGTRAGVQADWPALIDDWRFAYQPAMDQVIGGSQPWQDLDVLQARTLDGVLAERGVGLPDDARAALIRGWRQLRPWPDSAEGLEMLRTRYITATLSNGHVALLADLMKFADLRMDVLLSAQFSASYKPSPEAYLTALRLLECPVGEAGMVAAHAGDLRAAAALGIRPMFVSRPLEWGPVMREECPTELPGLVVADSLPALAEQLGC